MKSTYSKVLKLLNVSHSSQTFLYHMYVINYVIYKESSCFLFIVCMIFGFSRFCSLSNAKARRECQRLVLRIGVAGTLLASRVAEFQHPPSTNPQKTDKSNLFHLKRRYHDCFSIREETSSLLCFGIEFCWDSSEELGLLVSKETTDDKRTVERFHF